jgi:hypothetical protein
MIRNGTSLALRQPSQSPPFSAPADLGDDHGVEKLRCDERGEAAGRVAPLASRNREHHRGMAVGSLAPQAPGRRISFQGRFRFPGRLPVRRHGCRSLALKVDAPAHAVCDRESRHANIHQSASSTRSTARPATYDATRATIYRRTGCTIGSSASFSRSLTSTPFIQPGPGRNIIFIIRRHTGAAGPGL